LEKEKIDKKRFDTFSFRLEDMENIIQQDLISTGLIDGLDILLFGEMYKKVSMMTP
jgi:hypothetical protein